MFETTTADSHGSTTERGPSLVSRSIWRITGASAPTSRYEVGEGPRIPVGDGVALATRRYLAEAGTANPFLLLCTPYGLKASDSEAAFYASRGYDVLVIASRGTDTSGGDYWAMRDEAADGARILRWLKHQPWYRGFVTIGKSYSAFAQWALAESDVPEWLGMVTSVGPHDIGKVLWGRGPFELVSFFGWSRMMARRRSAPTSGLAMLNDLRKDAKDNAAALARKSLRDMSSRSMRLRAQWFDEWLLHPDPSDVYWADYRHDGPLATVSRPVLVIGAWHDVFLGQSLEQIESLQRRAVDVEGRIAFDGHADSKLRSALSPAESDATLDWLKSLPNRSAPLSADGETRAGSRITALVGGKSKTRPRELVVDSWPPHADTVRFGGEGRPLSLERGGVAEFTYDARDPTPSIGGAHMGPGAGVRNNNELEARGDVVFVTSEPLAAPLLVGGRPRLGVEVESTQSDFDLFVRLTDVDTRGRSRNVSDAIVRFDDRGNWTGPRVVDVELEPMMYEFAAGHRLRVQISGGAYPRFSLHPALRSYDEGPETSKSVRHRVVLDTLRLDLPRVSTGTRRSTQAASDGG
ncbi:CocE/NonD family hydrolase [Rhodococcus sp. BP-349]|uniref:CocE/NonD family hydrolase n=1 Tax=unclassified Rhodococcus (in: high G+C Gram-positive bacteria) TaxID=192944 RepID=UPI001C9B22E9|nr:MULTISPECIES: CocE/NonD family hydrolase [unclassified Rhodococcus (in: high G+C Gram-positive bacteria)]MBY6540345.1 CocE/NonD family hydrolase [Rhodococcus sp. BP-363]MBY6545630.1 CocE/NonD family hydrolase [Rhodococcus sp. BP-369]MBY6564860.1 CocE/NonD family hydrolase [Rhodococcus sp. BP-370]MBY6578204.1 CocE/NonD family hydrolase [Rhodococcus sp. BP-364]MBY6587505.1 CocE/NonD family hydrolase [Rhodococcus sp. BP-358]